MDTGSMKNIVILKDLHSNIVDEAIVFLKENQKLKNLELVDVEKKQNKTKEGGKGQEQKNSKDYIINEAQMLIADYISKLENKNKNEDISYKKLKKRYNFLKNISGFLLVAFVASIFFFFMF